MQSVQPTESNKNYLKTTKSHIQPPANEKSALSNSKELDQNEGFEFK